MFYVLYDKEYINSVNINSNNYSVYFKGDIIVKLSPWLTFYLPFILNQFVTSAKPPLAVHTFVSSD